MQSATFPMDVPARGLADSFSPGLYLHESWWKLLFTLGQALSSIPITHIASWIFFAKKNGGVL